ncbi:MAG: hypothetical protein ACP5MZ_02185 [Candidatus Micrarchaeia archaeon]
MAATKSRDLWDMYSNVDLNLRSYARLKGLWVYGYKLHYSDHYGVVMVLETRLNYLEPNKSDLLRREGNELSIDRRYGNVKLFVNHVNAIDRATQEMIRLLDSGTEVKIDINVMLKKNTAPTNLHQHRLGIKDYPFMLISNYPNSMIELTERQIKEENPTSSLPTMLLRTTRTNY